MNPKEKRKILNQIEEITKISNEFFLAGDPKRLEECEDFAWTLLAAMRRLEKDENTSESN